MPGVCAKTVLLLETTGRSVKLVDENTARKYTYAVERNLLSSVVFFFVVNLLVILN